jgi:hypothetical protein
MEYVIAVRTFERPSLFQQATLRILREQNLLGRLTVFVGSDIDAYMELEPDLQYVAVPKGGAEAIRAICAHYPRMTPILFLDDDLEKWWGGNLGELTQRAFQTSSFWGFGFLTNKLWMSKSPEWGPRYSACSGCAFGAMNVPELITTQYGHADDTVRTIQYLRHGIVPSAYHHAGFKTRYTKNPGGLQASGDRADTKMISELIAPTISDWISGIVLQKEGVWAPKLLPAAALKKKLRVLSIENR